MHHSPAFAVAVFGFFIVGTSLNVFRHASGMVNSSLNGIVTYRQYFRINGIDNLFKTFAALCVLLWWTWNQTAVETIALALWPSFLGTAPGWLQGVLVVTPATAGMFGLFWDVLLDIALVYLKKKFPQLNRDVPPTVSSVEQKVA